MHKGIQSRWILLCILSVVIGFIAGRWSADSTQNQQQNLTINKARVQEEQASEQTGTNSPQNVQTTSTPPIQKETENPFKAGLADKAVVPFPDQITGTQHETDNATLKAEMAAALKENGLSDEEIEQHIQVFFPQPAAPITSPLENAEDVPQEQLELEMASSLREAGVPEEHIDEFVKGFVGVIKPQQ